MTENWEQCQLALEPPSPILLRVREKLAKTAELAVAAR
jgi:hypothetical protein